ncbi:MAG TPA: anthranilate synthase component I [Bacteroidota bacterium]|nr:anthranilate synthase component I [Bacteroidota bacterium]
MVPLYEKLFADTETPVSVYSKIRDESPFSFLLESVEGGEHVGRYSFIGFNPFMNFEIRGKRFSLHPRHDDVMVLPRLVSEDDHPLEALKKIFAHLRPVRLSGLPRLTGGAIGYFSYEAAQLVENIPVAARDDLKIPDGFLMFCDLLLVFDNVSHSLYIVSNAYIPPNSTEQLLVEAYEKAAEELSTLSSLITSKQPAPLGAYTISAGFQRETSKGEFVENVRKTKQYIVEGDIFQLVLSQRVKRPADVDTFDLYRALRVVNPSPYMYYLSIDGTDIIGSSPEMLVRVENQRVETRPIAGTRARGESGEEDERLAQELLNDEKERAEHLMLVDLGRNDLGRISVFGSVSVKQLMTIERYSHVMHIVSSIQGKLRPDLTAVDALFACFPAGTLTGAPKIRAMEIIAELENVRRGVYGGAIVYFDFSGSMDSCIAIRTIVAKEKMLYFQAGAGIVFDSLPEREYEETLEKLGANLKALELIERRTATSLPTMAES